MASTRRSYTPEFKAEAVKLPAIQNLTWNGPKAKSLPLAELAEVLQAKNRSELFISGCRCHPL
jgi:hypothetical protein